MSFPAAPASAPAPPRAQPAETLYLQRPVSLEVLVPGLHQIRTGRATTGYALTGATALSLAGIVLSQFEYSRARADYLGASGPQQIADRYRAADNWSHARVVLSGTAVVCWLTGLITALRSP